MKPVAATQVHVRIGRVVVEPGALGAMPRAEFGQRLQSAIAAELAGAAEPQAVADPVTKLAGIIATQLPPAASNSWGRGRHGRR